MNIIRKYIDAMKFRFNRYPSHLILFVTGRCNAKCNHCFYWNELNKSGKEKELSLDEIRKISNNWGHIKLLSVTGGEPSLREDIADIVGIFHNNNGVTNVVMHTNGFLSEKVRDIAVRICRENPGLELNLAVSFDDLHEGHDKIRGVEGGFEKAKETLGLLIKEKKGRDNKNGLKNLNVTVNTCFTCFNQGRIKDVVDYFFERFDIDGYYIALVRGNSMDKRAKDIDIDKYKDAVDYLNKKNVIKSYYKNYPLASFRRTIDFLAPEIVIETLKKKRMIYPCKAGKSVVVISENGDVFPCEVLNKKFGNLREEGYDISNLIFSKNGKFIKSSIKTNNCYCTWECAIMNNLVFNWGAYPRLLCKWTELELKKLFGK